VAEAARAHRGPLEPDETLERRQKDLYVDLDTARKLEQTQLRWQDS